MASTQSWRTEGAACRIDGSLEGGVVTVHVKPAPQTSLDVKELQVDGLAQALDEAEKPDAVFSDHAELLAKWESKKGALSWASTGVPNAETVAAMGELEEGKGKSFASVDELLAGLNAFD